MPADSSIYSLIQQPKQLSPFEAYGNALQLKNLVGQQDVQNLQREALVRAADEDKRIRDLFAGGRTPTEAEVMSVSPKTGLAFTKANLENKRTQAAIDKDRVAALKDTIDIHRNALGSVNDQMAFSAWRANLVKEVPQFAATVPEQFSPDVKRDLLLKGEDLVKQLTPRFEMVDLGGRRQAVDMNPVTNPSIRGTALEKTLTPGEQATQAETRRHNAVSEAQGSVNVEGKIRDDFTAASKPFVTVRDAHQRVLESAREPSAAGDLALIFNFMKVLDPGSTVREGEFATAQNAAGIPDRLRAQYNKVINGERLADSQRNDFVSRSEKLYKAAETNQEKLEKNYEGIATRSGARPENVIIKSRVAYPKNQPNAPKPGPVLDPSKMSDDELKRELGL